MANKNKGTGKKDGLSGPLAAMIAGQIALQGCKIGTRVAAPLLVLGAGYPIWAVGLMLGLFALAPVFSAHHAGQYADRHGYHRPMLLAVGLSALGALFAVAASYFKPASFALLCIAAALLGAGSNTGLIAGQRSAGLFASSETERVQVFSWLGLAPALANMAGPMIAGCMIDLAGFGGAFAALALLPWAAIGTARFVPAEVRSPSSTPAAAKRVAWDLLARPDMRMLLFVNWVAVACWDILGLVLPILGHERGFSASAIGTILGIYPLAMAATRLAIPLLAHRIPGGRPLRWAMLCAALVFAIYPLLHAPWQMGACSALLGVSLGTVQPMILARLHQVTPHDRHGEAIALRSMTLNLSSAVSPLFLGVAGTALGVGALFWVMAAVATCGIWVARKVSEVPAPLEK